MCLKFDYIHVSFLLSFWSYGLAYAGNLASKLQVTALTTYVQQRCLTGTRLHHFSWLNFRIKDLSKEIWFYYSTCCTVCISYHRQRQIFSLYSWKHCSVVFKAWNTTIMLVNAFSFSDTNVFYFPSFTWLKVVKETENSLFWGQLCLFSLSVIIIQ